MLPGVPPPTLFARAFLLRALTGMDWPLDQALSWDAEVIRWTLYQPKMSGPQSRARVAGSLRGADEGRLYRYVVLDGEEVLGTAGIAARQPDAPEVFYALLPEGRGRGAATAAAQLLSDWALAAGSQAVALVTVCGNTGSEAVARRAGFEPGAVGRRDQRGVPMDMTSWIKHAP